MSERNRLVEITLDETAASQRSPLVEQERTIAIYDLLHGNRFCVEGHDAGPYHLHLSQAEKRLILDIRTKDGDGVAIFGLSLSPFRGIIRDYFMICESYYSAVRKANLSQIEAIDMGRRGIHNEGAALFSERLEGKITTDNDTARRLFTLICVLHYQGEH